MADANSTALVLLDFIPIVIPAFGGDEELLARVEQAVTAARAASIPVIHNRVVFRPGYPDVSDSNALFGPLRSMMDFTTGNPQTDFLPAFTPQDGEVEVVRRRVSGFAGSDFDVVLRAAGIRKLVIAGVATSGTVLSTVRQASDLDFELVVLSDGCADGDPEVHRVLTEKVFPSQATVTTVEEWVTSTKV